MCDYCVVWVGYKLVDYKKLCPAVSIVVNCRNSERYLLDSLKSINAQTYSDWEIILFDNASTDNTSNICKGWDNRLRYFASNTPLPLAAARNMALDQCRGSYIAFLDSDDLWIPNKLETQIMLFSKYKVSLIYTNCLRFSNNGNSSVMFGKNEIMPIGFCFNDILQKYCLVLSSVIIRKDFLKGVELYFDEKLEVAEEAELFLRIAYAHSIGYSRQILTHYRVHLESESWRKSKYFWVEAQYIIDKFRRTLPDFHINSSSQAAKYLNSARFGYAVSMWFRGENKLSRNELRNIRPISLKILLTMLMTFFPFFIAKIIIQIRYRHIYPSN